MLFLYIYIFFIAEFSGLNNISVIIKFETPCTMSNGIPAIHQEIPAFIPLVMKYVNEQSPP
ncbi:hypothetical protein SDC9_147218 [bioreactor metagenome]|uniref:Uncharacterized protein n=1 Tax=bioreactor metagenome TaxID=1076179 RepID=A0A645EGY9_9ZZZZ